MTVSTSRGSLVRVEGIRKSFRGRGGLFVGHQEVIWAVDGLHSHGVSFEIRQGETLALVGESGSGKSTVARIVMGLLRPDEGRVWLESRDVGAARGRELFSLRAMMQMVFQDPYSSLNPRRTVAATIAQPLALHSVVPKKDVTRRVHELLESVGLIPAGQFAQRYPHQLSGGQRQRVAIARAIASNPKLLVADEPVASLDVSVRASILQLLGEMRSRLGLAMLFISHDLGVVRAIADRVAVMYLGRIIEIGETEDLLTRPQHPYTKALLAAAPASNPAVARVRAKEIVRGEIPSLANPPSGCRFHPRCPRVFEPCPIREPQLFDFEGRKTACFLYDPKEVGADLG